MTFYIAPIVEGQTEEKCIELLLHRIWSEVLHVPLRLHVLKPSRSSRNAMVDPTHAEFQSKIDEVYTSLGRRLKMDSAGRGLILILLDAEEDCPANLAPKLLEAARKFVPSQSALSCVFAKRMLENWFVAGGSTLAGVNGLPDPLPQRDQFEDRSGVKWLDEQIRKKNKTRKYKKTVDAPEFVRAMNLPECLQNSPSFEKLCRELAAQIPPTAQSEDPPTAQSPS